jgi:hypothetical protein
MDATTKTRPVKETKKKVKASAPANKASSGLPEEENQELTIITKHGKSEVEEIKKADIIEKDLNDDVDENIENTIKTFTEHGESEEEIISDYENENDESEEEVITK